MQSLLVLVVLACCGLLAASPARPRRSLALPDGIPLELLFGACGDGSDSGDIGPCVEELLSGLIELAAPSFETGLDIGNKTVVLEPLSFKDIPANEKPGGKIRVSATDIQVAGVSSVKVEDVTLLSDELALNLSFTELQATGNLTLRGGFFTAQPHVNLTLIQPSIHVTAGWELQAVDDKLSIRLNNATVSVDIHAFSVQIEGISGLGRFLTNILNQNNQILLEFFKPQLEKQAQSMLEKELQTIKLCR